MLVQFSSAITPNKEEYQVTLTEKEKSILNDLKSQEQLCIEKYERYAAEACDPALREVFSSLKKTEENHLSTVSKILSGEEVSMSGQMPAAVQDKFSGAPSSCAEEQKKKDAFLVKDALSMEKHVSGVYDMGVFEFSSPVLRDTLAHIQKEEQNHGEKLYSYLSTNNMYS